MDQRSATPFDGIESAHEFLRILCECVAEAKQEIAADVEREGATPSRRLDALRIALYNLEKLEDHVNKGVRILNDLRSLRRLLFRERSAGADQPRPVEAAKAEMPAPKASKPRRGAQKRGVVVAA